MMNNSCLWKDYLPFKSLDFCRDHLTQHYEKQKFPNAKEAGYRNSVRFSHYLTHGAAHITEAEKTPVSLKPLLLFYGLAQLIKAALLVQEPNYPVSSQMLAHGLSTRKRKKQHFHYLNDSIKIQKNGLFPESARLMFHMKPQEGKVLLVRDLMYALPSLAPMIRKLYDKKENPAVTESVGEIKGKNTPNKTANDAPFPELLVHYSLLYHLSMISRYETEWWYEQGLQGATREHVLIMAFLLNCPQHMPSLVYSHLFQE